MDITVLMFNKIKIVSFFDPYIYFNVEEGLGPIRY